MSKSNKQFREGVEGVVTARRGFMKGMLAAGAGTAAVAASGSVGAPFIRTAKARGPAASASRFSRSGRTRSRRRPAAS